MKIIKTNYQRIKQGWLVFAGYFYLYIVVGNVIGEILVRLGDNEKGVCFPYWGMFGLLTYDCKNILLEYAWGITIGIPSLFVATPACIVKPIKWAIEGFYFPHDVFESNYFLLSLAATILIYIPGFFYWKKYSVVVPIVITLLLIIMIIYLGLRL